jgi:hypothetical protein
LTDDEIVAVDAAITRAWLQDLAFIKGDNVIQYLINRKIAYLPPGGWATCMPRDPRCRHAVHFGLGKNGEHYATQTLTLVSNDAVLDVLEDLFPDLSDGQMPDYTELLRSSRQ